MHPSVQPALKCLSAQQAILALHECHNSFRDEISPVARHAALAHVGAPAVEGLPARQTLDPDDNALGGIHQP
jgi:hypothetical protein